MSAIQDLAAFTAGMQSDRIGEQTVEHLRLHLLDTLGAMIVGGKTEEGAAVAGMVRDAGATGDVRAFGLPLRTTVSMAALATSAATRCTEIDDIHLESCTTPGSVIVPTALALAGWRPGTDVGSFLSAMLVGYDLLARFGRAVDGPSILYRGIWPTYLAGGFGATAVASRLLHLTEEQTAHALAAALTQTTGLSGRVSDGIASRWTTLGFAVQSGILAALAARRGFRGDLSLLDGAWSEMTGIGIDKGKLVNGLDTTFEVDQTSIKPYCAAKQATACIYGFIQILDEAEIGPDAVDRVVVAVPPHYAGMIDQPALPTNRLGSILGAQYQLALAAYKREELRNVLRPVIHQDDRMRRFMERVSVVADEDLVKYYPSAWPARVEVQLPSGRLDRLVLRTVGDPPNGLGWDELTQKFEQVTGPALGPGAARSIASICRGLGTRNSLADLLGVLAESSTST